MKFIFLILICLGLIISSYLLSSHFALANASAEGRADFCSALFGKSCDDALRSPLAVQFGLPLAGWGLVYYGTLVCLLLMGWTMGESFRSEATTAALVLSYAAVVGSVALFAAMLTDLAPFCPLCAIVHAINLLLLLSLKRLTGRSVNQSARAVGAAVRYLAVGKTADPVASRWKTVGFLTAGLVGVSIYQWVFVEYTLQAREAKAPIDPQKVIAEFKSGVQHEIPVSEADPGLGPTDAPVQMVVFNDFRCKGCKKLADTVTSLAQQFDGYLHIAFKHFPLDSVCNPLVKKESHAGACDDARAAEAAQEQGKFWPFHKAMFTSRVEGKATIESLARQLGLDINRFEAHRRGEAAMAKIKGDIELGIRLGVEGTPSVFLNGRRVHDIRPQVLLPLISNEIEQCECEEEVALKSSPQKSPLPPLRLAD